MPKLTLLLTSNSRRSLRRFAILATATAHSDRGLADPSQAARVMSLQDEDATRHCTSK